MKVLQTIYSKRDTFGNCYFAFRYMEDGGEVVGQVSGNNLRQCQAIARSGLPP
jgi:hypothetical protein